MSDRSRPNIKMQFPGLAPRLPGKNPFQSRRLRLFSPALPHSILCAFALMLGWGMATPVIAAERLKLKLGPFEQSVSIADLERFAKTGELSSALRPFSLLLTPDVRRVLGQRLQLDPSTIDRFLNDWLRSPAAEPLLRTVSSALPGSTIDQVNAAIVVGSRQVNGLSVIGLLRAFPGETVTVDTTSAIALALQINPSYWESQALSPLLERELTVSSAPFQADFDPAVPGSSTVQQRTLTLRDRQRQRTIPVDIYYSDNSSSLSLQENHERIKNKQLESYSSPLSPHPSLVVMSHGFGADRKFLVYLARHLASHGITVVALEHPGSNINWLSQASISGNAKDLIPATEFIDRPKDISFLLDELAEINQQSGSLQGKFNTEKVTVIGHSLGGYTALALAGGELHLDELRQACKSPNPLQQSPAEWLQCAAADLKQNRMQLRDARVVQAIALNPVVGQLFGKTGLSQIETPTLILSSTEDAFTPAVNHQLQPFTQLRSPKYLLTAIRATHLSVGQPGTLGTENTLFNELIGREAEPLRQLVQGVSLAFIKQLTPEAQIYTPYLTPAYAQSLSSSKLALRLNSDLPTSIYTWLKVVAAR